MKTKRHHHLAAALTGLALASSAHAAIIATEYFNGYGTGTTVYTESIPTGGGTGWTSDWSMSDNIYTGGASIAYSATGYNNSANLSGSSDGAMAFGSNRANPSVSTTFRTFSTTATTVWFSTLISMDGADRAILWLDATTGTPNDFIGVLDGQIAMRYEGSTVGTVGAYGDNTNPNGNATSTSGTHLLLAKAELDYSGSFDRLSFWFDPTLASGEAGLGTATITQDGVDAFGTTMDGIGVLMADTGGGAEYMDAIRVGTTFADVIPEPSSAALIGLAGACLLLRRRRL